jgi:hypothetical protein
MTDDFEELLDRPVTAAFTDEETRLLRAGILQDPKAEQLAANLIRVADLAEPGWALRPEAAHLFVRLRSRPEDEMTLASLQLDSALDRLVPLSVNYYRQRDEEARRPRQRIAKGVQR